MKKMSYKELEDQASVLSIRNLKKLGSRCLNLASDLERAVKISKELRSK